MVSRTMIFVAVATCVASIAATTCDGKDGVCQIGTNQLLQMDQTNLIGENRVLRGQDDDADNNTIAQDCQSCAQQFAASGGCAAMQTDADCWKGLIPDGCDSCGKEAEAYCHSQVCSDVDAMYKKCNDRGALTRCNEKAAGYTGNMPKDAFIEGCLCDDIGCPFAEMIGFCKANKANNCPLCAHLETSKCEAPPTVEMIDMNCDRIMDIEVVGKEEAVKEAVDVLMKMLREKCDSA